MGPSTPNPAPGPVAASHRVLKMRPCPELALVGALTLLCVTAAACGGGNDGAPVAQADDSEATPTEAAPVIELLSTRIGAGIAAAGGNLQAIQGDNPCNQPGAASTEPITIAYVGADFEELDAIGFETIVLEDPSLIISAYVNQVNFNGGINGRCVGLVTYSWSLTDPVGSFAQICADLPQQRPVFYFMLKLYDTHNTVLDCATIEAAVPTVGLYASTPVSTFVRTGRWLFTDDGDVERLLSRTLETARGSGVIDANDRVGLLQGSGPSAGMGVMISEAMISRVGVDHVNTANIPHEYGNLELLLSEKQVRLLESGLSESEREEAQQSLESIDAELAELFVQIEDFYTEAVARFKDAGVTAVVITSDWSDLRRMMRAADRIDWAPTWLANDIQSATSTLADAPKRQAQNLLQVSSRRAAGDEVPPLDQGCITLRNTTSEAPRFAHRPHTDAWNMITSVCDYLDVSFSALTRAEGRITRVSFTDAMNETHYELEHGGLITFTPGNRSGAERFRVLQADPDCVLNSWGCMRSTTDWLSPSTR